MARFPGTRDAFDLPILEQLAIVKRCAVDVSPHSGFSFAAQAVGVPWLAISGQEWQEYLPNGVALLALLPQCPRYHCHREMYQECRSAIDERRRSSCLSDEALLPRTPEIVDWIEQPARGALRYPDAAKLHRDRLRERLGTGAWILHDTRQLARG